jgi:hypothetical protein
MRASATLSSAIKAAATIRIIPLSCLSAGLWEGTEYVLSRLLVGRPECGHQTRWAKILEASYGLAFAVLRAEARVQAIQFAQQSRPGELSAGIVRHLLSLSCRSGNDSRINGDQLASVLRPNLNRTSSLE